MFLDKKDIPAGFIPMWYAGIANLAVCYVNLIVYNLNGGLWLTLFSSCISFAVVIGMFVLIKHKTQTMMWKALSKKSANDSSEDRCTTAPRRPKRRLT